MYFGEKVTKKFYLVNNSPKPTKFEIQFKKESKELDLEAEIANTRKNKKKKNYKVLEPFYDGEEKTQKIMGCSHMTGMVPAYSQIPLKMWCQSEVEEVANQWTADFAIAKPEVEESMEHAPCTPE